MWLRIGSNVEGRRGSCQYDKETSGFIKGGEFHTQLSDYKFFKQNSGPWSYLLR
jgi:hypothetical protein